MAFKNGDKVRHIPTGLPFTFGWTWQLDGVEYATCFAGNGAKHNLRACDLEPRE